MSIIDDMVFLLQQATAGSSLGEEHARQLAHLADVRARVDELERITEEVLASEQRTDEELLALKVEVARLTEEVTVALLTGQPPARIKVSDETADETAEATGVVLAYRREKRQGGT